MDSVTQDPTAPASAGSAPSRLTVLQVIPAMVSGGAELGAQQVAEALVANGDRAMLVSEGGRMVDAVRRAGAEHLVMPVATKNPLQMWWNAKALASMVRQENVDVIHVRSRAPAWSCLLASRWTKVPMITTYHSGYREENLFKRLYNSVMVRGDRVIAVSNWIADTIFSRYRPDPSSVVVIHRAVDPAVFDPASISKERKAALKEAWDIPDDVLVMLLPGRIAHRKGQHLVVRALHSIRDKVPPFVCVFAGDDQNKPAYRKRVESLISELGVSDLVRMPGYVNDMPAAYALSEVAISAATAPEGFQRGMLEAQAMGCVVVVSDVGPGIEVVLSPPTHAQHEMTGLNYDGESWLDLAEALRRVLSLSSEERGEIGARGSAWVRGTYTKERLTSATLAVYRDVLRPKPPIDVGAANVAERSPKILQIVPRLDSGGAEQTTVDIAAAIQEAGGAALVATQGGRMIRGLHGSGAHWIEFPAATKNPLRIITNAMRMKALIDQEGIGLLHARSRAPAWSAYLAANWSKTPFVTTYHGAYSETNAAKRWYNSVMARSHAVIANSHYTADLIESRHGPLGKRIHIIPRGIDLNYFDPDAISDSRKVAVRQQWRLTSSSKVILLPARLTEWKGQPIFVRTAKLLIEKGRRDLQFIMAGDLQGRYAYLESLRKGISEAGLENYVRIVGYCSDMAAAYSISACAVVPSTEPEAFGRTAVEAQAMGCPIVVSDIGATRETVVAPPDRSENQRTGWRCRTGDAAAFAEAIEAALAMPPEMQRAMAARARSHVETHFSTEVMSQRTLAVYDQILGSDLFSTAGERR